MSDIDNLGPEEIHSKVLRAGRRTYFFDVRSTKADDYYLTITESKKHTNHKGEVYYKKHKIYLYKEDFEAFKELLDETTNFIVRERGTEVISDKHEPDYQKKHTEQINLEEEGEENKQNADNPRAKASAFTNVSFDDI